MHISDQLHCETAGLPELDIVDILRGANAENSAHKPPVNRKAAKLLKRKLKLQYQHWLCSAAEALRRAEDAINQGRTLLPKRSAKRAEFLYRNRALIGCWASPE